MLPTLRLIKKIITPQIFLSFSLKYWSLYAISVKFGRNDHSYNKFVAITNKFWSYMFTLLHKLSRLQPIMVITYKHGPSNDVLITKFDCNLKKFKFSIKRRVKVFSDVPLLDTKCCLSSLWKCPFGVHFTLSDKYFHFYFPSFRAKTICRNMAWFNI